MYNVIVKIYRKEPDFDQDKIMKLGAQLYTVRKYTQNEEDYRLTFGTIKKMGYENVQLSGGFDMEPGKLRDLSDEFELPIVCTHSPFQRIVNDTEALIREHKVYNCPVIGIGSMPKEYRGTKEGVEKFLEVMETPVKKILDAGLGYSYHNHNFEFAPLSDSDEIAFDIMLERCPDWKFLMDTYWVDFAGYSSIEYIAKIGAKRITNVHFKDMANNEKRSICACGQGTLDFKAIYEQCKKYGVENVLVEQDNAAELGDPFEQIKLSFDHLRPIIK